MMRLRLRRRDLVCQQAVELVTDYLEGALSRSDRRRYEAHLAGCPHCTEYLAQMRKTIELTGTLTPDDLTPQMQDDFIALYRQWRADDPGETAARRLAGRRGSGDGEDDVGGLDDRGDLAALGQAELADRFHGDGGDQAHPVGLKFHVGDGLAAR